MHYMVVMCHVADEEPGYMIWYQHELKSLVPTCLVYCLITLCEMPSLEYAMPVKNSIISGQDGIVM